MDMRMKRLDNQSMSCSVCERTNGHARGCPEAHYSEYYSEQNQNNGRMSIDNCDVCGDPVVFGESYISNGCKVIHLDCVSSMSTRELLDWLDVNIEVAL